jgi:signal recognition particle GTPase
MADEEEMEEVDEFDPDEWLEGIINTPDIDQLEDEADEAEDEQREQKIAAKALKEIEELKKDVHRDKSERSKEAFKHKVDKFLSGVGDDDPRKEFLWILESATMDTFDNAVKTINDMGKRVAQVAGDTEDALQPPVYGEQSVKPNEREKKLNKLRSGDITGHERNEIAFDLWIDDTSLGKRFKK